MTFDLDEPTILANPPGAGESQAHFGGYPLFYKQVIA